MWNAFPAPKGSAEDAKKMIGGDVFAPWLLNTCVIRVSRSMNYAGHLVPQGFAGLSTVRGADGLRYAFRVEEFRKFLTFTYGPPSFTEDREPKAEPPQSFIGETGIICFRVKGWSDATGHVDLWDGSAVLHSAYFNKAYSILLWSVPTMGEPKMAPGADPVPIAASVGKGGANKPEDVARVQSLLDARGFEVGPSDGIVGPRTTAGIEAFQKRFLTSVDGRVDPLGRTFRELNGL